MVGLIITLIITTPIAWLWVNTIDKQIKYKKQNPDYNEEEGWLDWDKEK